ncbi:DCN1-like protein 3 [Oncorhynchus tshawytscha]|uniref:DCN1-like protein n=1 Tax=Oncorhynchus tshawytscha TaxID=74940 RepID=A0A8C8CHU6_ONCTS|nr:DCN1-like protein 3 [Oncorhynchus tshawytscha]XP_024243182.1 DCN1-like protein 3 [Oncorhynchus tshawytscha]XP_024243183.1 DCN1-like protein 3 [Oncorhynchus tshawytscha]XP_024243184.1 DCN1-like protein 3 [Oncorhynchus tshawytscha]
MGQCVTKCKNPSSSLGSKSGDKEPGSKSHHKKCGGTGGSGGGGHKEEPSSLSSKASSELMFNGTKNALEVTVETTMIPTSAMIGDLRNEEHSGADREGPSLLRIEELFCCYKDPQEESILEEGMERFCNDLYVDPAEFRVLVLAWKFQAATMCKFTRKEFVDGCRAIKADSLEGICSRFPFMLLEAQGEENFKELYRFTFQFGLDADEGQRSLQRDIAIALWRLVFTQDTPAILEHWLEFLGENPSGVRGISRDTWNMFLNFTQAIGPDLSNYSEDEAWPSLFDTFVEWEMERRRKEEQLKRAEEEDRGCTETDESSPSSTDRLETEGGRGSQTWGGQ